VDVGIAERKGVWQTEESAIKRGKKNNYSQIVNPGIGRNWSMYACVVCNIGDIG